MELSLPFKGKMLVRSLYIFMLLFLPQFVSSEAVYASFENRVKILYYEKVAEKFYRTREIPGHLDLAIKAYQSALNLGDGPSWRLYWRISRCYWMLGERESNSKKRLAHFSLGARFGKKAIKGNPQSSQGHLWYGMSLGSAALEKGVMNALYQKDTIKSELEEALRLNPKEVTALLGLAGWHYYVPQIFGGDTFKSFRILEKALTIDPNFTGTLLFKAKLLMNSGRVDEARKTLLRLSEINRPTSTGAIEDKAAAKILLQQMKEG